MPDTALPPGPAEESLADDEQLLAWAKERFELDEDELEAAMEQLQQSTEASAMGEEADVEDGEGDAGTGGDDEVMLAAPQPPHGPLVWLIPDLTFRFMAGGVT